MLRRSVNGVMNLTRQMGMTTKQYECQKMIAAVVWAAKIKGQTCGRPLYSPILQTVPLRFLFTHLNLFDIFFIKHGIDNHGTCRITGDVERGANHIEDTVKRKQQR